MYGAKRGHDNPAARAAELERRTRIAATGKTVGAVKRGILAASRIAVMQRRMIKRAHTLSACGDATRAAEPSVAGTSDSKHWTQEMHRFSERTKNPILSVTNLRAKPDGAFLPPPGIDIHRKRAAPSEPLARKTWANVAFFC